MLRRLFLLMLVSFALGSQDMAFRVNQMTFPLRDFDKQFMETLAQYKRDFLLQNDATLTLPELEQIKYGVLDTLIDRTVLLEYAQKLKIIISDKAVKARLAELKKRYPTPESFQNVLKESGIKPTQILESLRFQLTKEAIIDQVVKDTFAVSSQDILLYIRQKNIALFPIHYDLTLLVTDNKRWLESLNPEDVCPARWNSLRLNAADSSLNMIVLDSDLDFAMQSFLDTLEINNLSSSCPYDDNNYYRVRINQLKMSIPSNFKDMIQGIKAAIRDEKRSKRLSTWLKDQRQKTFVNVNIRAFPDFYHRESVL